MAAGSSLHDNEGQSASLRERKTDCPNLLQPCFEHQVERRLGRAAKSPKAGFLKDGPQSRFSGLRPERHLPLFGQRVRAADGRRSGIVQAADGRELTPTTSSEGPVFAGRSCRSGDKIETLREAWPTPSLATSTRGSQTGGSTDACRWRRRASPA